MSELATRERIATAETIALACRARSRWELGDAGGARAFAELARVRLAMLDEDLDAMLASLLCLVAYDEERGDGKAASEGYARLLDLAVRRHGAEHPSTLIAKRRLAQALYGRQMYDEAALALDDVGDRLAERLGSEHPAALDAEMLRALVEAEIGDRDAALRSMIDLQARYTRVVGPEHIMVATATYNVAVLHVRGGHAERALGPARRAYELRAARLGVDSRRTLESAGVLAMALSASDDRRGAMALLGRALANARPALGDRHPALLRMRATLLHFELADPRVAAGRVAEAEELLGDVEVHAPVPGALRTARAAVAVARRAAGEYDEALRHRAALHADLCAASGAASRPCRNASFDLARARLDAGDHDALAEARRILADQVHVDDPSLREVSAMHLALAEALERAGHRSEARVHYEAALPGLVVGGATGHTRARIAWGAARTLDRSLEDRRALARIARAQFVTEGSDADVEALDAWLETQR
jgi:hypothetical protein